MSESNVGLTAAYQGDQGARRLGPRQIFEMMLRKAELRSLLQIETAKIAEALPMLNTAEVGHLKQLLASEVADCDKDAEALRQQVDREAALAASTKAMNVQLGREASRALQAEMMRQIERRGFCAAPAQLAADAIKLAYGL